MKLLNYNHNFSYDKAYNNSILIFLAVLLLNSQFILCTNGKLEYFDAVSHFAEPESDNLSSMRIIGSVTFNLLFPTIDAMSRVDEFISKSVNAVVVDTHRLHCKINNNGTTEPFTEYFRDLPIDVDIVSHGQNAMSDDNLVQRLETASNMPLDRNGLGWRFTFLKQEPDYNLKRIQVIFVILMQHTLADGFSGLAIVRKFIEHMETSMTDPDYDPVPEDTRLVASAPPLVKGRYKSDYFQGKYRHLSFVMYIYATGKMIKDGLLNAFWSLWNWQGHTVTKEEEEALRGTGPNRLQLVRFDEETLNRLKVMGRENGGASITSALLAASLAAYKEVTKEVTGRKKNPPVCTNSGIAINIRNFAKPRIDHMEVGNYVFMMSSAFCLKETDLFWPKATAFRRRIRKEVGTVKEKLNILNTFTNPFLVKALVQSRRPIDKRPMTIVQSNLNALPDVSSEHVKVVDVLGTSNSYFRAALQLFALTSGTFNGQLSVMIATTRGQVTDEEAALFASSFKRVLEEASLDSSYSIAGKHKRDQNN